MKRLIVVGCLAAAALLLRSAAGQEGEAKTAKAALQELNDYIGGWKGSGTSDRDQLDIWKEHADWGWRFKGDDAWLTLKLTPGKHFKGGELRYLPDREIYRMTLLDAAGKKLTFDGKLKRGRLTLQRRDPDTGATQQVQMNLAGGGVRFVYTYSVRAASRTFFTKQFQVGFTKEGEAFAATRKKVECIVTGGQGTIPVSYNGVTYFVCCSGCRDAFNENPAKYVREYQARKKGGD
jgi:YHS domain-containing protein